QDDRAVRLVAHLHHDGALAQIVGNDALARETLAATTSAALACGLLRLRGADVPAQATERSALARLLAREAVLGQALILVEVDAAPDDALRGTPLVPALHHRTHSPHPP